MTKKHGGKRERAGRRAGIPNRATAARARDLATTGALPLDVMVRKMRWHLSAADIELDRSKPNLAKVARSLDKAEESAKAAAQFVHPKLSSVDHAHSFDPTKLNDNELNTLEQLLAKSASARRAEDDPRGTSSTSH